LPKKHWKKGRPGHRPLKMGIKWSVIKNSRSFLNNLFFHHTESLAKHQGIVDLIGQYSWKEVVLVGGDFQKLQHPYKRFDNSDN